MSVVVALKYNNGVIIGADKQTTCDMTKTDDGVKIIRTKYSNHCIGTTGDQRDSNIIFCIDEIMSYKDILDNVNVNLKYVCSNIIPNLINILEKHSRIIKLDGLQTTNSTFIYCTKNKLFKIGIDFAVVEYDDFVSIGCGDTAVNSSINAQLDGRSVTSLSHQEAKSIIYTAITQGCKDNIFVGDDIDYIELKCDKNIIYPKMKFKKLNIT